MGMLTSGHPFLYIHLNPIHLKYTNIAKLPDFVRVQQLHSSCAFVEVIFGSVPLSYSMLISEKLRRTFFMSFSPVDEI